MRKQTLGVMSMAATIVTAGAVRARADVQAAAPHCRGGAARADRLAQYLGLTEEQQASWKSLHEQHKTEMAPLWQEGRDLHQKLRTAMGAENPDPTAVGAATLALHQHREKVRTAEKAFQGQLTNLLTPEQKTKFEAFTAADRGRGRHGGARGWRGSKGGGPTSSPAAPVQG